MAVAQIAQYLGFQSTMTDSFLLFSSIFGFHAKKNRLVHLKSMSFID